MKFTTVVLFALISFVDALPTNIVARDVYAPPILTPHAGDEWPIGTEQTVTWNTTNPPKQITNPHGSIMLRKDERTMNLTLASGFDILSGRINVTVPNVTPGSYCLVLFGDSGNFGPLFTISSVS